MSDVQPTSTSIVSLAGKAIVDKCQKEVDRVQRSDIDAATGVGNISQIIWTEGPGVGIDGAKLREALKSYIEIINDIAKDAERRASDGSARGQPRDEPEDESPDVDVPRGGRRTPSPVAPIKDIHPVGRANDGRRKRARDINDDDDDSESDGEKPGKRVFDPKLLHFTSSSSAESRLHPSLVQINKLKANYRSDLTASVQIILDAVDLPEFPPNLWRDIIQGFFIEFDKLLSASHSISGDPTEVKRVGDVELHTNSIKITRHVVDKLDWTEAFTIWASAVKFAFPGRDQELERYGTHILKLFKGTGERYHNTVIDYDRAVRTRVGRSNTLRYCDFAEFADLDRAHLHPHGSESNNGHASQARSRSTGKAPRLPATASSTELCQRFQVGKEHGNRCLYKHVCETCGDPGHGRQLCPRRNAGQGN